jgi:hypothetical protein
LDRERERERETERKEGNRMLEKGFERPLDWLGGKWT